MGAFGGVVSQMAPKFCSPGVLGELGERGPRYPDKQAHKTSVNSGSRRAEKRHPGAAREPPHPNSGRRVPKRPGHEERQPGR